MAGLGLNLFLCGIKLVCGLVAASQALVADAVHTLSDSTIDVAVLVGIPFWSAPADDRHPYGHRRIEEMALATAGSSGFTRCGRGTSAPSFRWTRTSWSMRT